MKTLVPAVLCAAVVLTSGLAVAQEPPTAPGPQIPATPSMDQKGSDDMSKPAGALKTAAPTPKASASKKPTKAGALKRKAAKHPGAGHAMTRHRAAGHRAVKRSSSAHATGKHAAKQKHHK